VLDVGCGAGLLSEAMAREGAHVTALDLAPELVEVARLHLLESGLEVDYLLQSVESLAAVARTNLDLHPHDPRAKIPLDEPDQAEQAKERS
jgi:2-polyprenyl-6-hydroxyphenyl methylase/3-demethylubiquinone-9 3-methyltransferase